VRRYHYWLTTKRVIWCHGFIGYQVRSVPLERIADVVISRTLPEMLAGISSIDIRDMTGQTQTEMPSVRAWAQNGLALKMRPNSKAFLEQKNR